MPTMLLRMLPFLGLLLTFTASLSAQNHLTVSAAISLKPALEAMRPDYERATGDTLRFNFGASGGLLAQIKAGAPVDVFISAAEKQMDDLMRDDLGDPTTRVVVARGRLVLIVPADRGKGISGLTDLATDRVRRLATGQPKTVPAGDYAAQVLDKSGLSAAVEDKLVYGANVRQVLDYVVRGEVDAGIVYATDAHDAGDAVKIIVTIDESLHEPIVYPAAVVRRAINRQSAERFLAYLMSESAQRTFREKRFDTGPAPVAAPVVSTVTPTTAPATESNAVLAR